MQLLFAKSISHIFSPIIVWPMFLLLLMYGTGLEAADQRHVLIPFLLCEIVLPMIALSLFRTRGWISDIEITNVRERRHFFVVILVIHLAAVIVLAWLINEPIIWQIRLLAWIIEVIGAVITWFWKISVHLAANSFVIAIVVYLYGWQWWPLLLALPVIAWARVVQKKHTIMQTIAGTALTFAVTAIGFFLLRTVPAASLPV